MIESRIKFSQSYCIIPCHRPLTTKDIFRYIFHKSWTISSSHCRTFQPNLDEILRLKITFTLQHTKIHVCLLVTLIAYFLLPFFLLFRSSRLVSSRLVSSTPFLSDSLYPWTLPAYNFTCYDERRNERTFYLVFPSILLSFITKGADHQS